MPDLLTVMNALDWHLALVDKILGVLTIPVRSSRTSGIMFVLEGGKPVVILEVSRMFEFASICDRTLTLGDFAL
jgi:hypothetical protein